MINPPIEFNDPDLSAALTQFPADFAKRLQYASDDAKTLEKWLQECKVCIDAAVDAPAGLSLHWMKWGKSWRIVANWNRGGEDIWRPLIETPALIRVAAHQHLAHLVNALVQEIDVYL